VNPCFSFLKPYEPAPAGHNAVVTSASHFTIRTAQSRDVATLAEILTDSFHPPTGFMRWAAPILRLGIYEDLRNRLRSPAPHYACFVAVASVPKPTGCFEELVGTVEVALRSSSWQPRASQYPYISNLAVSQSCRRQGVARQLLVACERASLEWGYSDLYLHVLDNNHQARQLYLKAGYELHQAESSYTTLLFGRPKRLFLHKHLMPLTS
jgi:ribosomal protein S18 acetylase RimI-like enzyme